MDLSCNHHSGHYCFLASPAKKMDKRKKKQQMIRPLRKRHLQIWSALAILIPVSIVSALLVRPKDIASGLLQPTNVEALPVVIETIEREDYVVRLRGNNQ